MCVCVFVLPGHSSRAHRHHEATSDDHPAPSSIWRWTHGAPWFSIHHCCRPLQRDSQIPGPGLLLGPQNLSAKGAWLHNQSGVYLQLPRRQLVWRSAPELLGAEEFQWRWSSAELAGGGGRGGEGWREEPDASPHLPADFRGSRGPSSGES